MNLTINDYQQQLIKTVRELGEQQIKPYYLDTDFSKSPSSFDWHLVELIGELNLVCPTIPVEYGGLGLDIFTVALIIEEICTFCPGLATIIQANIHSVQPILLAGNNAQKESVLPKLTGKNACLNSYAITEPSGGSDIYSMITFAQKVPGGFIINGRKDFIINAPVAEYITLFAYTDHLHKKSTMRCFIVPRNAPGVNIGSIRDLSCLDYCQQAEIVFNNVEIGADMILKESEVCSGYLLLNETQDIGRVLTGAASVGIAKAAFQIAFDFANQRIQSNKKIFNHQAITHTIVDMATKIEMARLMTWKACKLIDQGEDFTVASAMAKLCASKIAQEVTAAASDILGARALLRSSFMDRLCNDARALSTVEGTNHIQRNIIASLL